MKNHPEPLQNKPNWHWINWFRSLPANEIHMIRIKIINDCMINDDIFRNWLYSLSRVKVQCHSIIEKIAGQKLDFTYTPRQKTGSAKKTAQ